MAMGEDEANQRVSSKVKTVLSPFCRLCMTSTGNMLLCCALCPYWSEMMRPPSSTMSTWMPPGRVAMFLSCDRRERLISMTSRAPPSVGPVTATMGWSVTADKKMGLMRKYALSLDLNTSLWDKSSPIRSSKRVPLALRPSCSVATETTLPVASNK
jgi:hypothetical protein